MCGGLAHWRAGELVNGFDSISEARGIYHLSKYDFQFQSRFPSSHWPSLRCIILIFNDREKDTGSTVGMQRTVQTSNLLKRRIQIDVPERVDRLEFANILFIYLKHFKLIDAYSNRDFPVLGEIIMRDSNQFHAVCMDTYPPLQVFHNLFRVI